MQSKVKICLVDFWFYPMFTGAGKLSLRLCHQLRHWGAEVSVLTAKLTNSPMIEKVDGLLVVRLPVFGPRALQMAIFSIAVFFVILLQAHKFNVIYCPGVSWASLACILCSKILKKKIVVRLSLMGGDSPQAIRKRRPGGSIQFGIFSMADIIVSINPIMTEELLRCRIPAEKVKTIPNGVDLELFKPANATVKNVLRNQLKIPQDSIVVIFVGGIIPRKGVDILIEAWKKVLSGYPKSFLLLVGPIYPSHPRNGAFYAELQQKIKAWRLEDAVRFTGEVDNVADYLRASDIFVFPSQREGMPNALLEAMACGLPCIIAKFIGYSEYIARDGEEAIVIERDAHVFSQAILELIKSPDFRDKLGKKARERIEKEFCADVMVQRYVDIFDSAGC